MKCRSWVGTPARTYIGCLVLLSKSYLKYLEHLILFSAWRLRLLRCALIVGRLLQVVSEPVPTVMSCRRLDG